MIISHSRKFIFLRNAKTGSTTAEVLLRLSGAFDPSVDILTGTAEWALPPHNVPDRGPEKMNWHHATPQQLIDCGALTLEQLREYDCWAFVRDVRGRFISGCIHLSRQANSERWKHGVQPHKFLENFKSKRYLYSAEEIVGRDQREWFFVGDEQVVQPLVFDNYDQELHFLLDRVGGYQYPEIPKLNRASFHTRRHNEKWKAWYAAAWDYPEVNEAIMAEYADDEAFYQKAVQTRIALNNLTTLSEEIR